jgi:hypothetical protein
MHSLILRNLQQRFVPQQRLQKQRLQKKWIVLPELQRQKLWKQRIALNVHPVLELVRSHGLCLPPAVERQH